MMFSWWKRRRRRKILALPFPKTWEGILRTNVAHYSQLKEHEREKLRRAVQIFVAEKYWEGCRGLMVTDEMRVTIAGHACLLVLGLGDEYFDRLQTVLIYPDTYVAQDTRIGPAGVVSEAAYPRLGELWHYGPVILSWSSVQMAGKPSGRPGNVVLHEFAHFLDALDDGFDGTPPLQNADQYRTWNAVMAAESQRLIQESQQGHPTLLDEYGTENEAEFFAVATECFFEQPVAMRQRHPQLYALLSDFYRQDPATRILAQTG